MGRQKLKTYELLNPLNFKKSVSENYFKGLFLHFVISLTKNWIRRGNFCGLVGGRQRQAEWQPMES